MAYANTSTYFGSGNGSILGGFNEKDHGHFFEFSQNLGEDAIDQLLEENPDMPTSEKEAHLRIHIQADAFSPKELDEQLVTYGCKAPSGGAYGPSFPFNLMFKTSIGPEGTSVGYLRPETAQGLFVNFRRLLDANAQKMPFAAAQIGLGFRNGEYFMF